MTRSFSSNDWAPGQVWTDEGNVESLLDRETLKLTVRHTGDRPIQIGSHFHFFEVNKALAFDRRKSWGYRLAIPAGTAVRFEPGQTQTVELVAYVGERVVYGFNALVEGALDDPSVKKSGLSKAQNRGFLVEEQGGSL
jgi:urease beta subunit